MTYIFSKNISELFSKTAFGAFYVLLLVKGMAIFSNGAASPLTIFVLAAFFLLTVLDSFWGIWVFVATIPLFNGFFLLKGGGDISLAFIGVYLAWFPKHLFRKKHLHRSTTAVFLTNLLAFIIFLNLCLVVMRIMEFPIPSRSWFDWFAYFPFVNQNNTLWQINAVFMFLQGILLFRMLDLELTSRNKIGVFVKTLYVQGVVIAGYSLAQLINFKIDGVNYLGLYLPFADIHSYGSYVVLLLIIFTYFALNGTATSTVVGEDLPGRNIKIGPLSFFLGYLSKFFRYFCRLTSKSATNAFLALIFFFLCCYSSSRITWLAMGGVLFFLVIGAIKNRKILLYLGVFVAFAFVAGNLAVPRLLQSNNPSLHRLGTVLNVGKINKEESLLIRYELWDRSLEMVKDYPLTGVGLGNYYRNNVHYKDSSLGRWDLENAHNYFLQLLAELGIPGLLLFLSFICSLYLRQFTLPLGEKYFLIKEDSAKPFLYGLGAYLVTMLTGHPLLIASQQFLFWSIVAIITKKHYLVISSPEKTGLEGKQLKLVGLFAFSLFVIGFVKNINENEPWTIPVEYGLYSVENWNGEETRWMAGKAEYFLPEKTKKLNLKVIAQPFNSGNPEGLTVLISLNDSLVDEVQFLDGGTKRLSYDVPSDKEEAVKVTLEVTKVFCPQKIGLNNDSRTLGVALSVDD